ncbi:MAG: DUF58 domain-containing protein [Propionibacteriaceae bacterium]|nr:DUF58 domain-containing protein [Propionibacteriaceae bacterium]
MPPESGVSRHRAGRVRLRPTVRGVLLALGALYCLGLGIGGAYPVPAAVGAILGVLVLADVCALIGRTRWWRGLSLGRRVVPNPAVAGGAVTLSWSTLGPRPFNATVVQDLPASFEPVTDPDAAHVLVTATRRGRVDLPGPRAALLGPFGLGQAKVTFGDGPAVTVWPAWAALDVALRGGVDQEAAGRGGLPQPNPEDTTVREYATGDEWRRIHWRSSARRGRLMTRAEEPAHLPAALVRLAADPGAGVTAQELAVSLAASLVAALDAAGFTLHLDAGGVQTGRWPALFDQLAGFDATAGSAEATGRALGAVSRADTAAPEDAADPDVAAQPSLTVAVVAPAAAEPAHLTGVLPAPGTALAVVVGAASDAWLAALDRAGWAACPVTPETPRPAAADAVAAALDPLLRGLR